MTTTSGPMDDGLADALAVLRPGEAVALITEGKSFRICDAETFDALLAERDRLRDLCDKLMAPSTNTLN